MNHSDFESRKTLRVAVLFASGIETLFWLYVVVNAMAHSAEPDKPFMIEAIAVTLVFIPAVLPALILSSAERWLVLATILATIGGGIYVFLVYVALVGI